MRQSFLIFIMLTFVLFMTSFNSNAQVKWRFGFEWNEGTLLGWSDPILNQLLVKLERLGTKGGINVNAQGSWGAMQSSPTAAINWTQNDSIITLFQRYGFSLTWYLSCTAPWAFPNKPDCQPDTIGPLVLYRNCAPESEFEPYWIDYVTAIVERYDGDGTDDMPGLIKPVQFYILPGEIKFGMTGIGDEEKGPFWFDTIDNLLHLHRLTYQAIREADPTRNSRVVSSGAVLWDLYADFPDYPEFDPANPDSKIRKRLSGENYKGSSYTAGWDSLKKMLDSFGNDADGIECDYIGWHPHFNWRVIDQEFAFIRAHAGNKSIYVDDMWTNLDAQGYFAPIPGIPGIAQFNAPANPFAGTDWVQRINGDFPNLLFTSIDPYAELFQKLNKDDQTGLDWYYANGARRLVKSFVSAFGEGAIAVSFSGTNDLPRNLLIPNSRGWPGGWINLLGNRLEGYFEKPQYFTYKLLIEKLSDFTIVTELPVSNDPLTRVYKFDRPRGSIYIMWSETGDAPPNLDYNIPTGETVTFGVESDTLLLTHIITRTADTTPEVETRIIQNRQMTIKLGYEPIFLEPILSANVETLSHSLLPSHFLVEQNYPNPFNRLTVIKYQLPQASEVEIAVFNPQGQRVATLLKNYQSAGFYKLIWNGTDESGQLAASGIYLYRLHVNDWMQTRKMILIQ